MVEADTINRCATARSDIVAIGVSKKWSLRSGSFLDPKRGVAHEMAACKGANLGCAGTQNGSTDCTPPTACAQTCEPLHVFVKVALTFTLQHKPSCLNVFIMTLVRLLVAQRRQVFHLIGLLKNAWLAT